MNLILLGGAFRHHILFTVIPNRGHKSPSEAAAPHFFILMSHSSPGPQSSPSDPGQRRLRWGEWGCCISVKFNGELGRLGSYRSIAWQKSRLCYFLCPKINFMAEKMYIFNTGLTYACESVILQVVVLFFIPSPTQCSGVVCEVSPQTVSATWETKDLHLLCSSKLRRKHPRVSVIVHTVRYEALASLLKIKDTGVHQQMDMFMWFCAATMFKWDISLMLSLQLSRLVPRFYQTNDHSLKQTDSRASAWLGPPGVGGSASSGVYQAERWHTVQTEESGCYQKPCRALLCCCCYWAT